MIGAWVVETLGDGSLVSRGFYEFLQLPVCGDRVALPNERGHFDVLGVIEVEHSPLRVPRADGSGLRKEPSATLYVKWLKEEDRKSPS
jgi:hypothetical protein